VVASLRTGHAAGHNFGLAILGQVFNIIFSLMMRGQAFALFAAREHQRPFAAEAAAATRGHDRPRLV